MLGPKVEGRRYTDVADWGNSTWLLLMADAGSDTLNGQLLAQPMPGSSSFVPGRKQQAAATLIAHSRWANLVTMRDMPGHIHIRALRRQMPWSHPTTACTPSLPPGHMHWSCTSASCGA